MRDERLLSAEALVAIRERADKATPGEWKPDEIEPAWEDEPSQWWVIGPGWIEYGFDENVLLSEADARFVASARTDVPALLAHTEAQAERIAALEGLVQLLEWGATAISHSVICPSCRASYPNHALGCELAALLGKEDGDE